MENNASKTKLRIFRASFRLVFILAFFYASAFGFMFLAHNTEYEPIMRELFGMDTTQWFIKSMMGYAAFLVVILVLGAGEVEVVVSDYSKLDK